LKVINCIRKIAESDKYLRIVCPSVRPHETSRLQLDRFFKKFDICGFFENLSRKIKVSLKTDENNGYFSWRL